MHQKWMARALEQARRALERGEVPVGAVVVVDDEIVGEGHNLVETLQDPTAHAEMLAIQAAASRLGTWRLDDVALYVTLEPCPMCFGAMHLARVPLVVYGAPDPRFGACGSAVDLRSLKSMITDMQVIGGIEAEASQALLKTFFQKLRTTKENLGQ